MAGYHTVEQHPDPVMMQTLTLLRQQEQDLCPQENSTLSMPSSRRALVIERPTPTIAFELADSIHDRVRGMLSKSRLRRQTENIRLLGPEDILRVERILGAGAFSQVAEVTASDGRRYACKHLKEDLLHRPKEFKTAAAELAYEAHMMSSFDHPNILKIRGWARNGISSFQQGRHDSFFLLLDLLDETLDQRIDRWNQDQSCLDQRTSSLRFLEKLQILIEISSALDYVHEHGVVFRDLKPNNIGLRRGQVQLFDFGLSRELPLLDTKTPFNMSGKVGTIRYMAPEVLLHEPYNVSADVYSWTMVACEILTGEKPFSGWTPDLYTEYVCRQGMRPDLSAIPHGDLQLLLQHCWISNASQRPTFPHIIGQLLLYQEQLRLSMEEQDLHHQMLLQQQLQIQHHIHQHQIQQQAFYIVDLKDMAPQPQHSIQYMGKLSLSHSVGTLETESIGAASLGW